MTVTNDNTGRTNIYAKETPMQVMDVYETANERAEMLNGRAAMLGVIAAMRILCRDWSIDSWCVVMTEVLFTVTSVTFFVILSFSVEKVLSTYEF